jgi:transposase
LGPFLPVQIVEEREWRHRATGAQSRIEIDLAGGHRLRITGSYDPEALARLIRGLSV